MFAVVFVVVNVLINMTGKRTDPLPILISNQGVFPAPLLPQKRHFDIETNSYRNWEIADTYVLYYDDHCIVEVPV